MLACENRYAEFGDAHCRAFFLELMGDGFRLRGVVPARREWAAGGVVVKMGGLVRSRDKGSGGNPG